MWNWLFTIGSQLFNELGISAGLSDATWHTILSTSPASRFARFLTEYIRVQIHDFAEMFAETPTLPRHYINRTPAYVTRFSPRTLFWLGFLFPPFWAICWLNYDLYRRFERAQGRPVETLRVNIRPHRPMSQGPVASRQRPSGAVTTTAVREHAIWDDEGMSWAGKCWAATVMVGMFLGLAAVAAVLFMARSRAPRPQ